MRIPVASRTERGATAILVSASALALFGVLAFVVDFGVAYGNQRHLQNAADAAVLAAGGVVLRNSEAFDTCTEMTSDPAVMAEARDAGRTAFQANAPASATLATGNVVFACNDPALPGQVVISASATMNQSASFGAVMGAQQYRLGKPAMSVIGPSENLLGLRPFALCEELADLRALDPDAYVNIDFDNADGGCGAAPGNFGTLDFQHWSTAPPPAPSGSCPGVSEVRPWISNGYGGSIPTSSPIFVEGDPGLPSNQYDTQFSAILGDPIALPVYDSRTGTGCGTSIYRITGFVEVKICGFQLSEGLPSRQVDTSCFDPTQPGVPVDGRFVQLRFTRFIPIGAINLSCRLGDVCDSGTPVLKLAD